MCMCEDRGEDSMAAHEGLSTDQSVDILSPLANLEWSENSCDWPGGISPQVVLLCDKIYVGVTSQRIGGPSGSFGEVHCSTTDLSSWTTLAAPSGIHKFGLGTYRSQLVLVGGVNYTHKVVGDVWTSEDRTKWQQLESLPPLPTPCQQPSVINTGSPEYLVVAGGYRDSVQFEALDTVSVLGEGQWFLVQRLPIPCGAISFTIFDGSIYLSGSIISTCTCYCRVDSLIAACDLVKSGGTFEVLWRELKMERLTLFPVSFGRRLVAVRTYRGMQTRAEVHAYHTFTQSWVPVGDFPIAQRPACAFVHTTGELVVLCHAIGRPMTGRKFKIMKATLRLSKYDPDSHFNMSALSKLEAAEIEVVTLLLKSHQQLVAAIGINDAPKDNLKLLMHCWLSGQNVRPATWRSLFEILRELGLEDLSQQIENRLSGTGAKSLKQQSTSVIMFALLQQRSLELCQLYGRLPCYVPPTVKRYIIHRYAAITHQVRCPVSPGLELECPIVLPFPTPQDPKQFQLLQVWSRHQVSMLRPSLQRLLICPLGPQLPPCSVNPQDIQPVPLPPRAMDPQAPRLVNSQAVQPRPQAVQPHPQAVQPRPQARPQAVQPRPQAVQPRPQARPQAVQPRPQAVQPHPQAVPPQPVVPQAIPSRPIDPQAIPSHPIDPQAIPLRPVEPRAVLHRPVVLQAVPLRPVDPQAIPHCPMDPQAMPPPLPPRPVNPWALHVPLHPVVTQAVPSRPVVPQAVPSRPVDPQAVLPPLPPRQQLRVRVLRQRLVPSPQPHPESQ